MGSWPQARATALLSPGKNEGLGSERVKSAARPSSRERIAMHVPILPSHRTIVHFSRARRDRCTDWRPFRRGRMPHGTAIVR